MCSVRARAIVTDRPGALFIAYSKYCDPHSITYPKDCLCEHSKAISRAENLHMFNGSPA